MNMMIVGNGNTSAPSHSGGGAPPSVSRPPTASSHSSSRPQLAALSSSRPPPAHVTQLTSSPTLGQTGHAVQHHPPPAPNHREPPYPRQVPMSPQRSSTSRSRSSGSRLPSHYNTGLPMMGSSHPHLSSHHILPSPAHQLLPSNVNSPSLIPSNIPHSFLPQIPLQFSPAPRSPQLRVSSPLPADNVILPPHAFKKLTRPPTGVEEDPEATESPPNIGRRNLVSPRQRERRSYFSNVALQDHNYCAVPPPSPPRSPTPPLSPYPINMGAQPAPSQDPQVNDRQSFSFGIAGYNKSSSSPNVGAYPSPHYAGPQAPVSATPLSRLKQTIEEAGVGPMTPLGEESGSPLSGDKSHESRPSPDRDGGEETETAPEAEDEVGEDAVTRCICDFLHDDGFMICCDKCSVWQHVVCMALDKNNLPDEYLCERCQPRPFDKKRAKAVQRTREKEIFKTQVHLDTSDDEKKTLTPGMLKGRKPGVRKGLGVKKPGLPEKKVDKKKKTGKRRSLKSELTSTAGKEAGQKKPSPRKNPRRKSASATDIETEEDNPNDAMALRSWIDTYEEAVTNHYSPELRARLQGAKVPTNQFKPKEVNGIRERCNVSLRGNGMKALTANSYIPAHTPVIECRGKYMLASQLSSRGRAADFVLYHRITPDLEVCIDSKTYGNDSRFCRRADTKAAEFNAEVKHHLDKGSLHLYIVSTKAIEKNQEILLSPEAKNGTLPPLSIQDELRQIKKVNGLLDEKKSRKTVNAKRRLKRETVKKELCDSSSEDDMPVSIRKTRSNAIYDKHEKTVNFNLKTEEVKEEVKVEEEVKEEKAVTPDVSAVADDVTDVLLKKENNTEPKQEKREQIKSKPESNSPDKLKELKIEIKEEKVEVPVLGSEAKLSSEPAEVSDLNAALKSPEGGSALAPAKSPGKPVLGLPDQSGLIVGVNTINYDASLRNKSKTREEKKMEMILKAIEAMERAEARKRSENAESGSERSTSKRRRSNSMKKDNPDSNLDGSSADENAADKLDRPRVSKGKRRRNISNRRRSRAKSGDSTSAMSADEGVITNLDSESTPTPGEHQPFKFPFKKQLLHEHFNADSEDVDDDVSGHYIRGSRSPPGIANHLLRSAVTNHAGAKSPTKNIGCSAKKRWLRAAMSEDHSEDVSGSNLAASSPGQSGASPGQAGGSPEPDYTPLKKRRLATYNESTEDKQKASESALQNDTPRQMINEKIKSLPNGLKKRLISNLILDAVLDKAMSEKFPDSPPPRPQEEEEEETEKENKEDSSEKSLDKKKSKVVKKGKGKKSDRVEENGLEDGDSSNKLESTNSVEDSNNRLEETEHKISSEICDGTSLDMTDGLATSEPDLGDKLEIIVGCRPPEDKEDTSTLLSAQTSRLKEEEEKPPTPVQHSVFKSFFSTELSFDDIDRQIEAKRVELARETSVNSVLSPRYESLSDEQAPRTPSSLSNHSTNQSSKLDSTPTTPAPAKKRVTIADYKKRKQATTHAEPESPADSVLNSTSILSLETTLPNLSGLNAKKDRSSPVFEKKTRSNSPLSKSRSSPQVLEMKTRSSSPSLDRKARASSPYGDKKYRAGSPHTDRNRLSSANKSRERSGSPRKGGVTHAKSEKWEARPKEPVNKVRTHQTASNSLKRARDPPSSKHAPPPTVPCPPVTTVPAVPVYTPRPRIPTPDEPREDLTERLRKEFGLNIEDSEGDGSDSESSGPGGNGPTTDLKLAAAVGRASNGPVGGEKWSEDCGSYWNRDNLRREHANSQL